MVAEHFGLAMRLHQPSMDALTERMRRIHPDRALTENNLKQAYFPEGAIVMPNRRGTAPGCIVEAEGKAVAVLPGPPRELKDMFEQQLAPYLLARQEMNLPPGSIATSACANPTWKPTCCTCSTARTPRWRCTAARAR
jgi:molybdopterin-biosynthesis enzyme MoeA-like protein